jgi:predicted ATPase
LIEYVTGGKSMPQPVLSEILARTDGVPLFIEELTKTVLEAGVLREDQERYEFAGAPLQTIPATLQESLLARLDRLGPGKEVAQIGAVIGREFSYELLRAVAAIPAPALDAAIERLLASELVHARDTSEVTTYVFKHALVRDAAEKMLLRTRKRELHERIARALEQGFPEIVEAQPELIAHHYREANNLPKLVRYLSFAGDRALSRSALKEAREHIAEALQYIAGIPDDEARSRDELKLQIALARTLLEQKGYADGQVGEAYAKARELSGRVGDTGMHLAVLYGLWAHHYVRGKPAAMLEQAHEFLTVTASHDSSTRPSGVTIRRNMARRRQRDKICERALARTSVRRSTRIDRGHSRCQVTPVRPPRPRKMPCSEVKRWSKTISRASMPCGTPEWRTCSCATWTRLRRSTGN